MTTEQQLPEGWKKTTLGEISIIKMGQSPSGQSYNKQNNGYQLIGGASDLGEKFPQPQKFTSDAIKLSKINDIIICIRATIGRLNLSDKVYCLGRGVAGIEVNENIETKFIWYSLMNNEAYLLKNSTGTTFQQISSPTLKKLPIIYPTSKETQQAIVNKIESLFDEIDEGIGHLKTAAQQIQQYRQSLLKRAFNGELTKEWRSKHADTLPSENELLAQIQTIREQHHAQQLADWQTAVSQWEQNGKEGKKPSKPSSLSSVNILSKDSELPENWLLTEAESICDFITKGTTPPKNELFMKSGEVPFLKVYNLTKNGKLDFTIEPTFVSKETHNNFLNRSKVYPNDILMNIVGPPLGKVSLVPDDYPEWNINQAIVIYRSIFVHSKFLANYLLAEKTIKLMSSQAKTTAGQHNLTLEICRNLPIPVCSLAEQTQIVAILESKLTACDQVADELAKQLKQAELLKQAVLKAAFSGSLLDK